MAIRRTIDLAKEISRDTLRTLFATGDKNAHRFTFIVKENDEVADLSNVVRARWYFLKLNELEEDTVFGDGEINGNEITFALNANCYTTEGPFALSLKLITDDSTATVYYSTGNMRKTQGDKLIDGDEVVITLEELEAVVARVEKWTNVTTSAESIPTSDPPRVTPSVTKNGINMHFAIPIGRDGVPGALYHQVPFIALADSWIDNGDGSYSQDIVVENMPDGPGELHLNAALIPIENAPTMIELLQMIWVAETYEGGVRLTAIGKPDADLPLLAGVYEWVT